MSCSCGTVYCFVLFFFEHHRQPLRCLTFFESYSATTSLLVLYLYSHLKQASKKIKKEAHWTFRLRHEHVLLVTNFLLLRATTARQYCISNSKPQKGRSQCLSSNNHTMDKAVGLGKQSTSISLQNNNN